MTADFLEKSASAKIARHAGPQIPGKAEVTGAIDLFDPATDILAVFYA
ncbi:hypothetical protein [Pararhizobium sp.]